MKVFIPHKKDPNPFFEEMLPFSKTLFKFGSFKEYEEDFPVVNIHWPEALLNWNLPSEQDLNNISFEIQKWKKNSKIVYTRHDAGHNFDEKLIHKKLFKLIENAADAFIHLGNFSKKTMEEQYPEKIHTVIPHPLYQKSFKKFEKAYARSQLKIQEDAIVMIAPGRIRKSTERDLLLSAFNAIPDQNKSLLSNRMLPFQSDLQFVGKHSLNKIFNVDKVRIKYLYKKFQPPRYIFNYNFLDFHTFSLMMSASDFVFISRTNILNSGNVLLGYTYKKPVIGPISGNITEQLTELNFPRFDPLSLDSVKTAVNEVLLLKGIQEKELFGTSLEKYHPIKIAELIDNFFYALNDA